MSTINCPRDNRSMVLDEYKTHPRHECKRCRGILLEGRHIAAALGKLRGGVADTAEGSPLLLKLPASRFACPHDGAVMRVAVYSGVEIDVCPRCRSVWLDRGEYEKIVTIEKKKRTEDRKPAASESSNLVGEIADELDLAEDMVELVGEAVSALLQ
jgi:Zn-finger nucleic acid-binding protein